MRAPSDMQEDKIVEIKDLNINAIYAVTDPNGLKHRMYYKGRRELGPDQHLFLEVGRPDMGCWLLAAYVRKAVERWAQEDEKVCCVCGAEATYYRGWSCADGLVEDDGYLLSGRSYPLCDDCCNEADATGVPEAGLPLGTCILFTPLGGIDYGRIIGDMRKIREARA